VSDEEAKRNLLFVVQFSMLRDGAKNCFPIDLGYNITVSETTLVETKEVVTS
jgi:hypothetical protein